MGSKLLLHLISPPEIKVETPKIYETFVVFKDKEAIDKLILIKARYADRNKVLLETEKNGIYTYIFLDFFKTSTDGESFFYIEKLDMPKDEHKKYAPRFKYGEPDQ